MPNNIIEISTDNKKLSVYKGFLRIEEQGNVLKDIPFNSINSLIITAHNVIYTNNLLQRLCEENIPLMILDKTFSPQGLLLSYVGQNKQMEIQHLQVENKKPLTKKLWQILVMEKIKNQSKALDFWRKENPLGSIYKTVLSDDSSNREAYAAKLYFKSLFGGDFTRNRDLSGINSFLNYGYAILRSALARYVVAAGLNPAFGINHNNKLNPFCLVDDLIEPFRPIIDCVVYKIFQNNSQIDKLTPEYKKELSGILVKDFHNGDGNGISPLYMVLQQIVWDLIKIYKTKKINFNFNEYLFEENIY